MASFMPIPAVDVRGGHCVRLVQGDFAREPKYADDPAEMARHWESEGAKRLHVVGRVVFTVVGRDGLLEGPDIEMTREIAREIAVIGSGGVATVQHLRALAHAGAEGAIVGTALYEGRLSLKEAIAC